MLSLAIARCLRDGLDYADSRRSRRFSLLRLGWLVDTMGNFFGLWRDMRSLSTIGLMVAPLVYSRVEYGKLVVFRESVQNISGVYGTHDHGLTSRYRNPNLSLRMEVQDLIQIVNVSEQEARDKMNAIEKESKIWFWKQNQCFYKIIQQHQRRAREDLETVVGCSTATTSGRTKTS